MKKVAVVTGGSSGIGLETCKLLQEQGYIVYDLSRHSNSVSDIKHIDCDITNVEQVKNAITIVIDENKKIDLLINNAGIGISGAIEFTKEEQARKQMEVNFWGMANMVKAVLPYMREQKSGKIINISSVAAVVSIPFQAYYSISKSAVNMYTLALANEVRPFNIKVCAVMPGDTKTNFTKMREKAEEGDDIYRGVISRSVTKMEKDEQSGMTPEKIAKLVCKVANKKHVKPLYTAGIQYKAVIVLAKILPYGLANKIIGRIYSR